MILIEQEKNQDLLSVMQNAVKSVYTHTHTYTQTERLVDELGVLLREVEVLMEQFNMIHDANNIKGQKILCCTFGFS